MFVIFRDGHVIVWPNVYDGRTNGVEWRHVQLDGYAVIVVLVGHMERAIEHQHYRLGSVVHY